MADGRQGTGSRLLMVAGGLAVGLALYVVVAAFADLLVGSKRGWSDRPPELEVIYPNF